MKKINRFLNLILAISILLMLGSCSGGSPSGRRSNHQKANPKNYSPPNTNSQNNNNTSKNTSIKTTGTLTLSELYNKLKPSVFLVYTSDGTRGFQGSGFFVSKDGLAVSNYHVFEGTSQGFETIKTIDGEQFKIKKILEISKEKDYIIFQVNIGNYNIANPIPVVSQIPQIGEDVFAVGNPRGLASTLSKGIVSAFRENNTLIQTTAEITHGSSGGPLLNMKGEVIGITTSGLGEANLNFAVNIKSLNLYRFL